MFLVAACALSLLIATFLEEIMLLWHPKHLVNQAWTNCALNANWALSGAQNL